MTRTPRRRFVAGLCLLSLCLAGLTATVDGGEKKTDKPKFTNRLAKETSPYLLMHAHNPVDWYPWGEEAFAKAKKENKLVFLSIGYSSCYWCHVMERESFQNEEVAAALNKHFVCIKVDREERPEIDHIYMTALYMMRDGGGGWPLSMFLTPEGKPFFGGTYWPREDKMIDGEKLSGFKTVIKVIHEAYADQKEKVLKHADDIADRTIKELESLPGVALVTLDRKLIEPCIDSLKDNFDPEYGGFGSPARKFRGARFPTPPRLGLVLHEAVRTKSKELLGIVTLTLDQMAQGGMYDQLGGGFHRYSTERTWTVPHFEKMLYDNAQLVEVYANAYRQTKNPLYRRIVAETIEYVRREMMSPEFGFYSSQDAETHHEEGRFYVWTDKELDAALPEKAVNQFARKYFGADGKPNFEEKYHILTQRRALADVAKELNLSTADAEKRLAVVKGKLLAERDKRDRPLLNKIMLTAWSGLMIAGCAEAGSALKEPKYVEMAEKAAAFVLKHQRTPDGRLLRTYGAARGQKPKAARAAFLEDYAFIVHGLLNLHDATGDRKWLDEARALTDVMIRHHGDPKRGGYYFTAGDHEKLFARHKDQYDGPQPAGNSAALRNLTRLWEKTGDARYHAEADRGFKSFAIPLRSYPTSLTAMLHALDQYLEVRAARDKDAPPKK
jgi:uncharacterized protein YyaL (SSP411 family)